MNNNLLLFVCSVIIVFTGGTFIYTLESSSTRDVLPTILEVKSNDLYSLSSFKSYANYQDTCSFGTIKINTDTTFTLVYENPAKQNERSVIAFFNLENQNISFSSYDKIEIGIKTKQARRVALNLNIQGRDTACQFIQKHIEITNAKETYTLPLNQFSTPASWYEYHNVTQAEISTESETTIKSLSFEGCHLLTPGIQDEFTVFKIILKRDYKETYYGIVIMIILLITGIWILLNKPFKKESKIVYIPIGDNDEVDNESIEIKIARYLATNYTNPNLTLKDLKEEFLISKGELSKLIAAHTKYTFPQYLAHLRVDKAKKILLSDTKKTVAEIGFSVGFNSSTNFIRVFKAQEGITPKKYLDKK